jgi:tripartite-type tricarboxylate transporter receptor subunit TctC
MRSGRFGRLSFAVIIFFLLMGGENLAAEKKFPTRPIQVIITFQPGDTDNLLRPFIEKMPEYLGQPLSFVYKPGAGGSLGAGLAAAAKPDGYTLIGSSQSAVLVLPLTRKDLNYTWQSFAPICCLVEGALLVAVKSDAPWRSLKDLLADAKKSPGQITYTSSGTYAMPHLIMEALSSEAGVKLNYIPSQGGGPAATAVLGGHVNAFSGPLAPVFPHLMAGTMRLLALYNPKRIQAFPDVPTLAEIGYTIGASAVYGILAPRDTPKEVIEALYQSAKKAVENHRDFITGRLDNLGAQLLLKNPEEYTGLLARENELFSRILKTVIRQ